MSSMDFEVLFGRPRVRPGAPFSDQARPEAARAEKKCTKRGFRGIMDACESFVMFCREPALARRVFFVMKT